jgi:hypothetical protein
VACQCRAGDASFVSKLITHKRNAPRRKHMQNCTHRWQMSVETSPGHMTAGSVARDPSTAQTHRGAKCVSPPLRPRRQRAQSPQGARATRRPREYWSLAGRRG